MQLGTPMIGKRSIWTRGGREREGKLLKYRTETAEGERLPELVAQLAAGKRQQLYEQAKKLVKEPLRFVEDVSGPKQEFLDVPLRGSRSPSKFLKSTDYTHPLAMSTEIIGELTTRFAEGLPRRLCYQQLTNIKKAGATHVTTKLTKSYIPAFAIGRGPLPRDPLGRGRPPVLRREENGLLQTYMRIWWFGCVKTVEVTRESLGLYQLYLAESSSSPPVDTPGESLGQ
ncbi:hypothetical protein P692DRAFT_201809903 [Suillus brevipes Sb2]|nr:hypothetical protein P692DRAFT_201809903 [Suillus brevipes Sb2]